MSIEILDSRIAPATVVSPKVVTFTDVDGDEVTVKSRTARSTHRARNKIARVKVGNMTIKLPPGPGSIPLGPTGNVFIIDNS